MRFRKVMFCCHNIILNNIYSTSLLNVKLYNLNTSSIVRFCFCSHNNLSALEPEKNTNNLNEFKRLNYTGSKYVAQTLQQIFHINAVEAKVLMRQWPKLKNSGSELVVSNYKYFKQEGITIETLQKYPQLLSVADLKEKLIYLKQLYLDVNMTAPILLSNVDILRKMVEYSKNEKSTVQCGSRILYMSELLNVPVSEISEKLIHHSYVMRIPLKRLEKLLKILLDYGVEPRSILNDCWALRYNPEIAEQRLQRAIQNNVHTVKTWMIRCQDKVFERCINRQVENRKVLGSHSSVEEYLSKRLECTIQNARFLTEKYPAIEKMNILKMKEILDYLLKSGFTSEHIYRVPRILIHSLETTKARLEQLKQYGYVPTSLTILCKSKKDFDKFIKKQSKSITCSNKKLLELKEI